MGEKIIFRYHKMYNLRLYRQNRRIFASVKTNGRCETSFHHLLLIQIILENLI